MPKKGTVIVKIWGGLGNQLFLYAYARTMKEIGYDVKIDKQTFYERDFDKVVAKRQYLLDKFNITLKETRTNWFTERLIYTGRGRVWNKLRSIYKKHDKTNFIDAGVPADTFKGELFYLPKGKSYIQGYLQNDRYFRDIRHILVEEFTLKNRLDAVPASNSVSIHVRRGDYMGIPVFRVLGMDYYNAAMAEMDRRLETPIYYIFSDDTTWIRDNFPKDERHIIVADKYKFSDVEEMVFMSRCSSQIISNSTFSYWAAWLNPNSYKTVIAPDVWFNNGQKKGERILPESWIRM